MCLPGRTSLVNCSMSSTQLSRSGAFLLWLWCPKLYLVNRKKHLKFPFYHRISSKSVPRVKHVSSLKISTKCIQGLNIFGQIWKKRQHWFLRLHVCVCVFACVCACAYGCRCICTYMSVCAYVFAWVCAPVCLCMPMYLHVCVSVCDLLCGCVLHNLISIRKKKVTGYFWLIFPSSHQLGTRRMYSDHHRPWSVGNWHLDPVLESKRKER